MRQFLLSAGMTRKAIHASTISVCASRIPVLHSQSAEGEIKESNSDDLTCLKYKRQALKLRCPLTSGNRGSASSYQLGDVSLPPRGRKRPRSSGLLHSK